MKHLFLIKNQKSKFIYLFLLLLASFQASLFAQPEPSITPPPNLQPAIAGNLYTFTGSVALTSGTSFCRYEWSAGTNATLVGANNGTTANFRFADEWGEGTVILKVLYINQGGDCESPITSPTEAIFEVSIRSLRNKAPELASGGSQISVPLCNTSTIVSLKPFRYADTPTHTGAQIDSYEITVPSGWTVNGNTGTVTTALFPILRWAFPMAVLRVVSL